MWGRAVQPLREASVKRSVLLLRLAWFPKLMEHRSSIFLRCYQDRAFFLFLSESLFCLFKVPPLRKCLCSWWFFVSLVWDFRNELLMLSPMSWENLSLAISISWCLKFQTPTCACQHPAAHGWLAAILSKYRHVYLNTEATHVHYKSHQKV